MDSLVVDLVFPFWLRMLWADVSTSSSTSLCWAAIRGDRLGVTGCAALGGGTTLWGGTTLGGSTLGGITILGGVTVGEITGVVSGAGLRGWKSRWGLFAFHGVGNWAGTYTVWFWWGGWRWSGGVPEWVFMNRQLPPFLEDVPNALQLFEGCFTEVRWHATF